jgi:hypothetical protein
MEFEDYKKKYPNLFKTYPRSGFDVAPGWEVLVESLCDTLEWHIKNLPEEIQGGIECAQVKEKFGTLRFYMTQETPYISGAISMAEHMSAHICETCGLPGKIRVGGWTLTLCDLHHDQREQAKKK